MKEYIEREALIATLEKIAKEDRNNYFHLDEITQEIFDAPAADVVEVVRCKDCKHSWFNGVSLWLCQRESTLHSTRVEPDAYCSYGERRNPNDHP